jgi:hypothetical protein
VTVNVPGQVTTVTSPEPAAPPVVEQADPVPLAPGFDPAVSRAACEGATATTTQEDGAPGVNYYTLLQCFAWYRGGYEGPIDGYPDATAWQGIQRAAASLAGYAGPIDGSLSNGNAIKALQALAAQVGYEGPVDGDPGPNTYRFSASLFNSYLAGGWSAK